VENAELLSFHRNQSSSTNSLYFRTGKNVCFGLAKLTVSCTDRRRASVFLEDLSRTYDSAVKLLEAHCVKIKWMCEISWHIYFDGRLGSTCTLLRNMTCPSLSNRGGGRGGGPRLRLDLSGIEDPDPSPSMTVSSPGIVPRSTTGGAGIRRADLQRRQVVVMTCR
jgi:hypothetical protein